MDIQDLSASLRNI